MPKFNIVANIDNTTLIKSESGVIGINPVSSILTNKQDKTDNNLITTDKTIVGAINEILNNGTFAFNEVNSAINSLSLNKQDKIDNDLTTIDKTIVGSINEINSNNILTLIASLDTQTNILEFNETLFNPNTDELRIEILLFNVNSTGTQNRSCSVSLFCKDIDLTTNFINQVVSIGSATTNNISVTTLRLAKVGTNYQIQLFQRINNNTTNTINFTGIRVYSKKIL